ncbi:MAG: glycosyltransferase [Armatimonadetes bacterium]|nr:MAG: glycosyltransferase [Armatimonadota bacterium]
MASLIAPENDYRAVFTMPEIETALATVVIPVYNRTELLDNVLAGLSVQDTDSPFEVIVVDDGSEEDVGAVVDRWEDRLDIRYLRQDRDGRGAGRARNAGAAEASNDVLVFIDADCVPSPGFVAGHLALHRRADNLVVSASRHHIERQVTVDEVMASFDGLLEEAAPDKDRPEEPTAPDDWRRIFYRRTQRLQLGDEAYRAVLSGLMSVRRIRFEEVGGFDTAFRAWGGEDTELGWRLWNSGCFIVPNDETVVLHQRHLDLEAGSEGRSASRKRVLPLVADRVPHRFYRKYQGSRYTVPKVSWVVSGSSHESVERTLRRIADDQLADAEVILITSGEVAERYQALADGAPRFVLVGSFEEAVVNARGEFLCLVADTVLVPRTLPGRCLQLSDEPRTALVRVGYKSDAGRCLSLASIEEADAELNGGIPLFAFVKRRDLAMDREILSRPRDAFASLDARARSRLIVTDLVTVPEQAEVKGASPTISDIPDIGAGELSRAVRRSLKRRQTGERTGDATEMIDDRPLISYVGFTGNNNLGDEAMLLAAREVMPWARVEPHVPEADLVVLGGGTLLNADGYYLERVRRVDHPRARRAVLGTGVRSFEYWGETETLEQWLPFLDSCELVGLRGPDSVASLRSWGWHGPASVVGDLAFGLNRRDVERVDSAVFCPMWTDGRLIGGSDEATVKAFAEAVRVAEEEGLRPVILASHPSDDRAIVRIAKELGDARFDYIDGYRDVEQAIEVIASARIVVSERLHGSILAAAMGTPFVAIEYQPKVRDFVKSIDATDWCVRTDDPGGLASLVRTRLHHGAVDHDHVSHLGMQLRSAANQLAGSLGVSPSGV